jgi:deoxyribonuclease-4
MGEAGREATGGADPSPRLRIGAHMSVAGGVANAVARAVLHGCEALQIFAKNASQWRGKPLDPEDVRRFRTGVDEAALSPVISHASYLINLATANPALRIQSVDALADELARADALGLDAVVVHPGTRTSGSEQDALELVARAILEALQRRPSGRARILLEHTAGQGRTIGHRFEHLRTILELTDGSPRIGVCLDTCHLVASGYDIVSAAGFDETFRAFSREVGFDRLGAMHANDSRRPCGSRVDRHEHIGDGCLGTEPFRRLFADPRFAGQALLIETAKAPAAGRPHAIVSDPFDTRNLDTLRRLRIEAGTVAAV